MEAFIYLFICLETISESHYVAKIAQKGLGSPQ